MKKIKMTGVCVAALFVAQMVLALGWDADVPAGAKWSDGGNWQFGAAPTAADSAIFTATQANTYDVDVDVAGVTRLLQVGQQHTFNGTGSIAIGITPAANFQNSMYNTTAGTVTYNVGVTQTTTGAYWAQMYNNHGGTTVFNDSFALSSGSLLNVKGGTHTFNGDLTVGGTLRLDAATTVIIGGTGTSSISANYISTAGAGSKLYLNRAGAYTLADPSSGYMRVEQTQIHFGFDQAVGAGTDVRMYGLDVDSALVSDGDFDQNFGWLDCEGASRFDMGNDAAIWTFEDSSAQVWDPTGDGELILSNVDVDNTVIRFAIDGGTGLTGAQIGQITLNGSVLTTEDTTVDGGYLYVTQAIPEPTTVALFGFSAIGMLLYRRFVLVS